MFWKNKYSHESDDSWMLLKKIKKVGQKNGWPLWREIHMDALMHVK